MKIRTWSPDMTDKETADLGYWERNVLALHFAEGWYNDDTVTGYIGRGNPHYDRLQTTEPRYPGWRRVLSLAGGTITFHVPDDFDVGTLPRIEPNWDGHTTEEKWRRVLADRGMVGVPA